MRNIFIDIGGWDGSSSEFFLKHHPDSDLFEVYIFECDKNNIEKIKHKNIRATLIEKGAWSSSGTHRYYYGKDDGGSLYATKRTGNLNPDKYYDIDTIDLAEFITDNFKPEDYIIIKLNCEGAEYELIPHLHKHGLISWINKWYVQWHWNKVAISKAEHDRVVAMIPGYYRWRCQIEGEDFTKEFLDSLNTDL